LKPATSSGVREIFNNGGRQSETELSLGRNFLSHELFLTGEGGVRKLENKHEIQT